MPHLMKGREALRWFAVSCLLAVCACGGSAVNGPGLPPVKPIVLAPAPKSTSGMQVTGTLGTIPQRKIESVLTHKLRAFQRCFLEGSAQVELIGGEVRFAFAVDNSGTVTQLHLRASDVGHRATERCLLSVARRARFPEPRGGDGAEFSWGFGLEGLADVRPPVVLDGARVATETPEIMDAIAACTTEPVHVTAYVARGGQPLGAGVSSDKPVAEERLDCVAAAVVAGSLPEPGSYTGKVAFDSP